MSSSPVDVFVCLGRRSSVLALFNGRRWIVYQGRAEEVWGLGRFLRGKQLGWIALAQEIAGQSGVLRLAPRSHRMGSRLHVRSGRRFDVIIWLRNRRWE